MWPRTLDPRPWIYFPNDQVMTSCIVTKCSLQSYFNRRITMMSVHEHVPSFAQWSPTPTKAQRLTPCKRAHKWYSNKCLPTMLAHKHVKVDQRLATALKVQVVPACKGQKVSPSVLFKYTPPYPHTSWNMSSWVPTSFKAQVETWCWDKNVYYAKDLSLHPLSF